jgi:predicted transcriptional regulator
MKMFREKESGNRNRLEIIADILEVAKDGQLKTRILYDGNLNFVQLNEYLAFMIKMGFLEVNTDNEKRIYRTTNRGFKYLESYEEISSLLTNEPDKPRKKSLYATR